MCECQLDFLKEVGWFICSPLPVSVIRTDDFTLQVFKIYEAVRFDDEQVRYPDGG